MPWNPDLYNQFKAIRYRPFYDLADLIKPSDMRGAVDLGCGTGEQTAMLASRFPEINFLGIDASAEMLEKATSYTEKNLQFERQTIEDFLTSQSKWDILFSNAALQWVDQHDALFPKLLARLNPHGQLVVQMPVQTENLLNRILLNLINEEPFITYLKGWQRPSPVLSLDQYAQILFDQGMMDIELVQKVYPIIADNYETLFDFIAGSALVPYMERLNNEQKEDLTKMFKERIEAAFPRLPAIYAFKRLLIYARKGRA